MNDHNILTINTITKKYQTPQHTVTALDNVSLVARPGEFVLIGGKSGSGKTTLLLCSGGLLHPDTGSIKLTDVDVYAATVKERNMLRGREIGFVFQQFHLVPYLTVEENIMVPSIALKNENPRKRAGELMATLDLTHRASHFPNQLSTGEKQRTALARAFFNNPKLILADEPTGNLDKENAGIVVEYLKDFCQNGGTVVLVTHDTALFETGNSTTYQMANGVLSRA